MRSSRVFCYLFVGILAVASPQAGASEIEKDLEEILSHEKPSHDQRAIWVLDDFEAPNLDDWTDLTTSCSAWPSDSGPGQGMRSLEIEGGCGHYGGLWRSLGNSRLTGISFMVKSGSTASADTYVVVGDDNVTVDNGAVFFYARHDGYWALSSEGSVKRCQPYSDDTWYEVDWVLDWDWRTVSVWVDDEMCLAHVPFRSDTVAALTQIHVYNYDFGPGWWDYIVVSTPSISPMIFSDGFDSGDATAWSLSTPPIPALLYVFDGGTKPEAIGGREGADVMCYQAAQANPDLPDGVMTRALISVNESDEVRDMPTRYGVPTNRKIVGPTGIKIVDSWADLLDGSLDQSFFIAGVTDATNFWYSGSNWDGSVTPNTCSGWTSTDAADGWYGLTNQTNNDWIDIAAASCGAATYHVLCLAWR
ncbi:MAG: hypothetical protein DRJ65_08150 [Acidobacteria bacterium]|nr:MAG: hypothetical protein DRJ65_08150 [Acidobacteriota bacterium]